MGYAGENENTNNAVKREIPRSTYGTVLFERGKDTRETIINKAAALFARYGFNEVTMTKIASAASISSAAIYRYFESKEKLFESIIDRAIGEFETRMARLAAVYTSAENFEDVIDALFEEIDGSSLLLNYVISIIQTEQFSVESAKSLYIDTVHNKAISMLKQLLDIMIEKEEIRNFDSTSASWVIVSVILSAAQLKVHQDFGDESLNYNIEDLVQGIKKFFIAVCKDFRIASSGQAESLPPSSLDRTITS